MDSDPPGVPWPRDPWNEIIPGLYQGGQIDLMSAGGIVRVRSEFDAVYSFFWRDEEGNGPDPDVYHAHHFIPDGELTYDALCSAKNYAKIVAMNVTHGDKVLVRCQAGYNRSGLVVALALLELGYSADDAINLIREKRSPHALHNEHFVRYIREADHAKA